MNPIPIPKTYTIQTLMMPTIMPPIPKTTMTNTIQTMMIMPMRMSMPPHKSMPPRKATAKRTDCLLSSLPRWIPVFTRTHHSVETTFASGTEAR